MKVQLISCFIVIALWLTACTTDEDSPPVHPPKIPIGEQKQQYGYRIYLENSLSLNGYMNVSGDSNFNSNVYGFITSVSGLTSKRYLDLYDVNKVLIPVAKNADAEQVDNYIKNLNAETFRARSKTKGGDQSQSDLSSILKGVLDSATADDINILITDGVFSPGKDKDARNYLDRQKFSISGSVTKKFEKLELATLVLQFYADFKGVYYYQDNTPAKDKFFKQRPYYVICFGPEAGLSRLLKLVQQPNKFKGFRNFLFLTQRKSYEVAARVKQCADYYSCDVDNPLTVSEVVVGGKDNQFRIKILADLSDLPVSAAYLEDKSNYQASKGYTIESIQATEKGRYTHEITLLAVRPVIGVVKLSLKRQLPGWTKAGNLDADKNLTADSLSGKTFGIRYLLEGMYEAYDAYLQSNEYFTTSISVQE